MLVDVLRDEIPIRITTGWWYHKRIKVPGNQFAACGAVVPHLRRPENGNIGTLTRRVPADRVVSAIPTPRGTLTR